MTIKINQKNTRVDPPRITLYGQRIDAPRYNYRGTRELVWPVGNPSAAFWKNTGTNRYTDTISTLEEVVSVHDGNIQVRKRESLLYRSDVDVRFILDKTYTLQTYGASRRATVGTDRFIGAMLPGVTGNTHAEIYYTINGKDPMRTKSNLYTGVFTIKRNESGSDNTILKARTYVQGRASEVIKVEFMIIRPNENLV